MSSYTAPANLHTKNTENGEATANFGIKTGLAQMFKVCILYLLIA